MRICSITAAFPTGDLKELSESPINQIKSPTALAGLVVWTPKAWNGVLTGILAQLIS